ncbi:MAG: type II toxin-antitoxin system RelE/ParE family toxin [Bacteroidota bacterium]|nr:type II toxin-antitoxin system RelE/ParE family toxin [Chitinophagaceae bacterium]MDZ4808234.1 type II toxin-antitoxin system RelE/ParE family toxin [Bacteroidota bacterium]
MHGNRVRYFRTEFFEEVREFLKSIDEKAADKIIYNLNIAEQTNDPKLFKKLNNNIWEFRTKYRNLQYRLLAFWDKTDITDTLVLATHGIIKKTDKVPQKEIDKAENIRRNHFKQKK